MRSYVRAGVLSLLVIALTGCTAEERDSAGPTHSVIVPGAPGEPARTVPAERASELARPTKPNRADISFMQQMITHHQQAIEMTDLAPGRVAAGEVRGIASRIGDSQRPEIKAMSGWLRRHDLPLPGAGHQMDHGEHGHGEHMEHGGQPIRMTGMATEAQLAELRDTRGAAFDRLFLRLMITHHEGAVRMAKDLLDQGSADPAVEQLALDVIATQTDEIGRMRGMRTA